jgi:branched-chain amino acid transport system substrate-binding protein
MRRVWPKAALTVVSGALAFGGCGGNSGGSTTVSASAASSGAGATGGSRTGPAITSQCGDKPGVKATGTPIKLGAIANKQPGVDFTDVTNMAAAYFACVNANGGVNGHPIVYEILTEQTNPAQVAAEAHKLVDHGALGIVGSISAIECTVDHAYWEHLGYYEIDAGYAPECYSTPNSAAVNMGARYSSDGAVQYVIAHGAKKIVFDQANSPINDYVFDGVRAVATAAHVPITTVSDNTAVLQDPRSIALRDVNAAGPDGAVVLDYPPPNALSILQAAQKLKLEDQVKLWGCSTPCNTGFVARALGRKWDHKLFVNAELLNPDTDNSPNMHLYKAILSQYGSSVSGGIGSFSQMGFAIGEITVNALESIDSPYTVNSVNQALKNVTNLETGQLCRSWTYGDFPLHVPNNVDITVTPNNGHMVVAQGCNPISSADPGIAAYRKLAG